MREIICIVCPRGCRLDVQVSDGEVNVNGAFCRRGSEYGIAEAIRPMRTFSTSIRVEGGTHKLVSVKPNQPVPRERVVDIVRYLAGLKVKAPVQRGQVLVDGVLEIDVKIVATRSVEDT